MVMETLINQTAAEKVICQNTVHHNLGMCWRKLPYSEILDLIQFKNEDTFENLKVEGN